MLYLFIDYFQNVSIHRKILKIVYGLSRNRQTSIHMYEIKERKYVFLGSTVGGS